MSSKEFLEIAKDSEDLVPRKLCWAMRWETHYRQNRSFTEMIISMLFALSLLMILCYSFSISGLLVVPISFAIAFALVFSLHWADARQNHENAKITLERIRKELDMEL